LEGRSAGWNSHRWKASPVNSSLTAGPGLPTPQKEPEPGPDAHRPPGNGSGSEICWISWDSSKNSERAWRNSRSPSPPSQT
jgi:hypothetical protein